MTQGAAKNGSSEPKKKLRFNDDTKMKAKGGVRKSSVPSSLPPIKKQKKNAANKVVQGAANVGEGSVVPQKKNASSDQKEMVHFNEDKTAPSRKLAAQDGSVKRGASSGALLSRGKQVQGSDKLYQVVQQVAMVDDIQAGKLPFQKLGCSSASLKRFNQLGMMTEWKPLFDDNKFDQNGIPRRSNHEASDVLSAITGTQNTRKEKEIAKELCAIQKRVRKALENVDMELDGEEEEEIKVVAGGPVFVFDMFDTRAERAKVAERDYIIAKIDDFEVKSIVRNQYLTELNGWFEDNIKLPNDMVTPEDLKECIYYTQDLHTNIRNHLEKFMVTGEQVVEKGKLLLQETSKIIAEKQAQMAKKTNKERIIVYDDKTVLAEPLKWEAATKTIISVFEDCQKMIKNLMFKNALKMGQKQFDYLMVAADRRFRELDEKKKTINELHGKLHAAKMQGEKMSREVEEQKKKMTKATSEIEETKRALEKMSEKNKELSTKIVELNAKLRMIEVALKEKMRPPAPPPTPPPPPEPETIIVKVIDSSTALELQEVEQELQEAKERIERLLIESNALQKALKIEKGQNTALKEELLELERREIPPSPTHQVPPPSPVSTPQVHPSPVSTPQVHPSPVSEPEPLTDRDANYYKTLMNGMKKEFGAEMDRVKGHMEKEKARGEASQRRVEMQHKDQLLSIQKDTLRMLRAIMHFRDHMLTCLQKENLTDQAQVLFDLGNLVKDKQSPDPREALASLVTSVIEYLHNMERILKNSFLAMKVLMKYQVDKQVELELKLRLAKHEKEKEVKTVVKDCKKKQTDIVDASEDIDKMAKKLKKAKNKMKKFEKSFDNATPNPDRRYNDLLGRYKQVIKMYENMQKEMENLQSDFHTTMQRKLEEKETMVISQMKMEMKQHKVINEEQLKLSMADQKENLRILTRAYDENKLSRELHSMATAMIQKTMEIPQTKLRNLFEQYIAFRAVQESKKRVKHLLWQEEGELAIDTREEMKNYLDQLDSKCSSNISEWRQQMKNLENEKLEMNKKIYKLFNELLLETGILMVHPLLKDSNKQNILTRAAATVTRKQMKALLFKRRGGAKNLLGVPDGITGSGMIKSAPVDIGWNSNNRPHPPSVPHPGINAPHMLDYEINKPKIVALRSLRANGRLSLKLRRTESFSIADHNHLQFIRNMPYQWAEHMVV